MTACLRSALVAGSLLALAGCPADPAGPDAPPGDADGGGGTGLRVAWQCRPEVIPGEASQSASIERAVFRVRSLRAVGDAGTIDLQSTTLEWALGIVPAAREAGAPPGLYSRLLFELDPDPEVYAFELTGTAEVGGVERPFTIRDRAVTTISLDFSIILPPGGGAVIPVRVELDKLVEAVDFEAVPLDDGRLVIEDGAQLIEVQQELRGAFGVHSGP